MHEDFFIEETKTVKAALALISKNKHRIVFVVNSASRAVIGSFSDGDFRRRIEKLDGLMNLDEQVGQHCNTNFKFFRQNVKNADLVQLFRNGVSVIPILDAKDRCVTLKFRNNETSFASIGIGGINPCYLIAEIGNNHNGDFESARELVKRAVEAGAHCVKFQMRSLEDLYALHKEENFDLGSEYTLNLLRKYSLSDQQLTMLFDYVLELGAEPLCTPWDKVSADKLNAYGMRFFKVASADFTNLDLLEHLALFNKPLILSTGMTELHEIEAVTEFLDNLGVEYALLHCNSAYPAPLKDINLQFMQVLKSKAEIIGYSGHELGINVSIAAVALGAKIIEKHFTLDKTLEGVDHKVSLLPEEFNMMAKGISDVEESLGSGKTRIRTQGELINRENLGKSVLADRDYKAGDIVKLADCIIKSPGIGLSPLEVKTFERQQLRKSIKAGEYFFTSHFDADSSLKVEYDLPGSWGLPVRYHDYDSFRKLLKPRVMEFHLSCKDMHLSPHDFIHQPTDTQLVVHAPELFENDHLLDLCAEDEVYRSQSIEYMRQVIEVTRNLANMFEQKEPTKIITNVGGHSDTDFLDSSQVEVRLTNLCQSLKTLQSPDVEILIQTMPPFPWHFGGQRFHNLFVNPDQISNFCHEHQMRICFDISHTKLACNNLKYDFKQAIEMLHPITGHYHIADADKDNGEGLQIGNGDIDWQELWPLITKLGMDQISWIPEVWQGHKDQGSGFAKAFALLENIK